VVVVVVLDFDGDGNGDLAARTSTMAAPRESL
jgi:hypothetical protein